MHSPVRGAGLSASRTNVREYRKRLGEGRRMGGREGEREGERLGRWVGGWVGGGGLFVTGREGSGTGQILIARGGGGGRCCLDP